MTISLTLQIKNMSVISTTNEQTVKTFNARNEQKILYYTIIWYALFLILIPCMDIGYSHLPSWHKMWYLIKYIDTLKYN